MRIALLAVAALAAALLAGCGGSSGESVATTTAVTTSAATTTTTAPPARSAYASALAALCVERRAALEAIGNPASPTELRKLLPRQLVVMRRFSARSKALRARAPEARAKTDFDRFYATYLDGQVYALKTLKANAYDGYFTVVNSALHWQKQAELTARRIGAVECARRPFG